MAGPSERDRRHGRRRVNTARSSVVHLIGEHTRQQNVKVLVRQGRKPQQARVQRLQLALRHRVEVDTRNMLLGTRALQPTEKNLGGARIRDRPLAQATLDLGVTRGLTARAGCAVRSCGWNLSAQPSAGVAVAVHDESSTGRFNPVGEAAQAAPFGHVGAESHFPPKP